MQKAKKRRKMFLKKKRIPNVQEIKKLMFDHSESAGIKQNAVDKSNNNEN